MSNDARMSSDMHIESVSASSNLIRDYGYFQDSCGTQFLAFDDSGNT